jgi:hypothetical protein
VDFYIKVGKPFASSYPNHCFPWLFKYLSLSIISLFGWSLTLINFHMLICCEDDLGIMCNYHREITPNTSCPWTIGTLSCGTYIWSSLHWLLLLIALSLAKNRICFNSRCLPWLLWFHLILLNLFGIISM